jgi:cystathionine beta-lyase/cystathionine gamma-synthase
LLVGIKDNLIRYSVGIEDAEDLVADLAEALKRT